MIDVIEAGEKCASSFFVGDIESDGLDVPRDLILRRSQTFAGTSSDCYARTFSLRCFRRGETDSRTSAEHHDIFVR